MGRALGYSEIDAAKRSSARGRLGRTDVHHGLLNLRRRWRWIFLSFAAILIAAVGLVSSLVLRLERDRTRAEAETARQDSIRLALWRLEGLMAPVVVLEARRSVQDYQPFASEDFAYTKLLHQIRPGDVLTPSPLLSWHSNSFPLHFQVDGEGRFTSPQAPDGNMLDLAGTWLTMDDVMENRARLSRLSEALGYPRLVELVARGERELTARLQEGLLPPAKPVEPQIPSNPEAQVAEQTLRTYGEWNARSQVATNFNRLKDGDANVVNPSTPMDQSVGPLVPFWTGTNAFDPGILLFARRVESGCEIEPSATLYQGFVCDWPRLESVFREQIVDLLPGATLRPRIDPLGQCEGTQLVSIPVDLDAPSAPLRIDAGWTPERFTLLGLWIATAAGLLAAGLGLRATITFGEKKSRFASAVTHELRTPLTTFQMYTEMLAEGMVDGEERRKEFLTTLHRESVRLSDLVESVLAYARVEEGRHRAPLEELAQSELVERLIPDLERRASLAGFRVEVASDVKNLAGTVWTNVDAVGLILGNLVDNAGKYASSRTENASENRVELHAHQSGGMFTLWVRDHGPGISAQHGKAIFEPFERGEDIHESVPGMGLGLALSRGLAREIGGELALISHDGPGAWFDLRLPTKPR